MKICILCHDFGEDNLKLQPWRYIFEMAKGLRESHNTVAIITDRQFESRSISGISIVYIKSLRSFPLVPNSTLISVISSEKYDLAFISISPIDFLYLNTYKRFGIPLIGVFTGPLYSLSEILRLGYKEIAKNFDYCFIHLLYSSIPSLLLCSFVNSNYFKKVIVMSRKNWRMLELKGVSMGKVLFLPAGIDECDLEKPKNYDSFTNEIWLEEKSFCILYFGSLISIRGIHDLLRAISKVCQEFPQIKLLVLSRRIGDDPAFAEIEIVEMIAKLKIENQVKIIYDSLNRDRIKSFILYCDVVALPFKLVTSDIPISILETMAMGKAIISTNIDGIPELIEEGRGFIVEPNDEKELIDVIKYCVNNKSVVLNTGNEAAKYIQKYPRWSQLSRVLSREATRISQDHRMSSMR